MLTAGGLGKLSLGQIADTVVVQPEGKKPENCTGALPSKEKDVIYQVTEEGAEEGGEGEGPEEAGDALEPRRKQLRSEDPNFNAREAARKERQEEILQRKNEETLRRLTEAKNQSDKFDPTKGGRRVRQPPA